ncbi:MAG: GAK system CofD-like protein [Desulfarculaceae bacterium]|nr:GAK system CofD-like protein [Desulfarculaceae bacterium]MCF8071535.1 GAK system CofD-like protein [Desulfarculaceae bacterium]MCF8102350.1 GAK system CofD-like protein [Desulfarculaceae bacterium]MCF8114814.1 GAK system CofD-like protein [Desulfarculaceae bacterium]
MSRDISITVTRRVLLPDQRKLARLERAPELGPNILFFSGGSALNPLCRVLVRYTHNSTHLITPFDSGGSSATLRKAFNMPAVGDLRNRMMALADRSVWGNPEVGRLFATRLDKGASPSELKAKLAGLVEGSAPLVAAIPDPLRKIVRTHLGFAAEALPAEFDLRGASLGNLVLVGGYLNQGRHLDPVIYMFSKLAMVRGTVRPVVSQDLQLTARLGDGSTVVGQHLLTGREVPPLASPIRELYLGHDGDGRPAEAPVIRDKVRRLIDKAELICYPMGSFYSSLLANLLPEGVSRAIRDNACPKVYVPSTGRDPEVVEPGVAFQTAELLRYLRQGREDIPAAEVLHYVLVDRDRGVYPGGVDEDAVRALGVRLVDASLVKQQDPERLDPEALAGVLASLV